MEAERLKEDARKDRNEAKVWAGCCCGFYIVCTTTGYVV